MKVQVTHIMVYDHVRRRPGEILTLKDKAHFTPSCMVKVSNTEKDTGPTPVGPIKAGNVPDFNPPPDVDEDTTTSRRKPTSMSEVAKKRKKPTRAGKGVGKK